MVSRRTHAKLAAQMAVLHAMVDAFNAVLRALSEGEL